MPSFLHDGNRTKGVTVFVNDFSSEIDAAQRRAERKEALRAAGEAALSAQKADENSRERESHRTKNEEAMKEDILRLNRANSQLLSDKKGLETVKEALEQSQRESGTEKSRLEIANKNLTLDKSTLTAEKSTLTEEKSTLTAERSALTAERSALTAEKSALMAQNSALTSQMSTLLSEKAVLTSTCTTFQKGLWSPQTDRTGSSCLPEMWHGYRVAIWSSQSKTVMDAAGNADHIYTWQFGMENGNQLFLLDKVEWPYWRINHHGKYWDAEHGGDGSPVKLVDYRDSEWQHWNIRLWTDGDVMFENRATKKVVWLMEADEGKNGGRIECHQNGAKQYWRLIIIP